MNDSKKIYYFMILFLLPVLLVGQKNLSIKKPLLDSEILNIHSKAKITQIKKSENKVKLSTIDTLIWTDDFNVDFGIFGQDWLVQWYFAPADMIVKSIGFNCYSADDPNIPLEIKLVKLNWTNDQIKNVGVQNLGYYPSDLNGETAFEDNPDASGDWISMNGDTTSGSPFGSDLWSDNGNGINVLPITNGKCQWIQMDTLGFEPEVEYGDIIGVAIKNTSNINDSNRVGFYATDQVFVPGFKYYSNGRNLPGTDIGWWSTEYNWDIRLEVNLISRLEYMISGTILNTTYSTEQRHVSAIIVASDSVAGVDSAFVMYKTNSDNDWSSVNMIKTDVDFYQADLPGFSPGTQVYYYYKAVEHDGFEFESPMYSYEIFKIEHTNLLVFNGFKQKPLNIYPQSFYFNTDDFPFEFYTAGLPYNYKGCFDIWTYGPLTSELLDNYKKIVEITSGGPNDINNDVIRKWIDKSSEHDYLLMGDEWLGLQTNWLDKEYTEGSFQYDILGITKAYNDINFKTFGDETLPSIVSPVEGSLLGEELSKLFKANGDTMLYNPKFEIGISNWLDGVEFRGDVDVFMTGIGIDSNRYNIGGSRKLDKGNHIAFMAFDPLALDAPEDNYYWYGYSYATPHIQAAEWMWICYEADVKNSDNQIPSKFELFQNYPNPFNPSTTIRYSVPRQGGQAAVEAQHISLKVYDVLGKEVMTLVNEKQNPGNYEIEFNASELASGFYIYQLKVGLLSFSKKMIYLK